MEKMGNNGNIFTRGIELIAVLLIILILLIFVAPFMGSLLAANPTFFALVIGLGSIILGLGGALLIMSILPARPNR